jgi:hypothetical protein
MKNQCDVAQHMVGGNDLQAGQAFDALGKVQGHAERHAASAVVPGNLKALEAEVRHDGDVVLAHRAKRIA